MPEAAAEALRTTIRQTLVKRTPTDGRPGTIADSFLDTWAELSKHLARVIGPRGVDVLLARAVRMTSATYPWLASSAADGDPLFDLRVLLPARPVEEATEASVALLVTFTELLTSLVGQPLCHRLLAPVWARSAEELRS